MEKGLRAKRVGLEVRDRRVARVKPVRRDGKVSSVKSDKLVFRVNPGALEKVVVKET